MLPFSSPLSFVFEIKIPLNIFFYFQFIFTLFSLYDELKKIV